MRARERKLFVGAEEVAGSYALGFGWFTEKRQRMVYVAAEMRQFDLSKRWQAQKSVIFGPPCRL